MAIKIHHGPPGSYKTAGAMADDFLREAKAGRVVVTNVRGVSRERTLEEFPELPASFDVIFVDDKTAEGRHRWATWFHWVPPGAFIFVDEVQDIWPKRWRESDIRQLDYPGGIEKASADGRPKDWEQALDKHRHMNWDMTLTTPSYAKVRDDIKGIADMAYKHKDLALLGFTGRYVEGAHAADDSGKSASDFVNIQRKKVPPYVFKLYDSTQTGRFTFTKSGFNLFKNPRVAMLLGIVLLCIGYVVTRPVPAVIAGSSSAAAPSAPSGSKGSSSAVPASGRVSVDSQGALSADADGRIEPFAVGDPYILASYRIGYRWRYSISHNGAEFTTTDLLDMGYTLEFAGSCGLRITRGSFHRFITCGVPQQQPAAAVRSSA